MAKGEIERDTIFYIIVMFIVMYIGASIVMGFNPLAWGKSGQLSQYFEPGKVYITNVNKQGSIEDLVKVNCTNPGSAAYIVTLNNPKFFYKGREKAIDFIVLLDYRNLLFLGDTGTAENKIHCTLPEDGQEFECPQDIKITFTLDGVGTLSDKQIFHFTTWLAKPEVITDAGKNGQTLKDMLDSRAPYYLSSFDVAFSSMEAECKQTECENIDNKIACKDKNADGCYWRSPLVWFSECKACPSETDCNKYDRDACTQCPIAMPNCRISSVLSGWSCIAR